MKSFFKTTGIIALAAVMVVALVLSGCPNQPSTVTVYAIWTENL